LRSPVTLLGLGDSILVNDLLLVLDEGTARAAAGEEAVPNDVATNVVLLAELSTFEEYEAVTVIKL
jgi:hypothetical protein